MLPTQLPVRLVLADDHELFRDGLSLLLRSDPRITVEGVAADGEELVELAARLQPQVVLTDITMPLLDGPAAARRIRQLSPRTGIVALSTHDGLPVVLEMLRAGACGYLLKNASRQEILEAVLAASRGEEYFCRAVSSRLAHFAIGDGDPRLVAFDERELAVIRYICREYTTEEIGRALFLGKRTVDGYRARILAKIKAKGTAGIVLYALKNGLCPQPDAVSC
ncbi:response regulator [Flaviaesturariibacter terrae]